MAAPATLGLSPATAVTMRDVLARLELRISLETEAAGLEASAATSSWPACAVLDSLKECARTGAATVEPDMEFHC